MEKAQKKTILFIGLGTITTAVLGFYGWQAYKDKQETKKKINAKSSTYGTSSPTTSTPSDTTKKSYVPHYSASSGTTGFPLQKGSKGDKVKALQQALIAKFGASIMPRYGADGDFGNETAAALKTAGLPSTIDLSTFNALTVGGSSSSSTSNSWSSGGSIDAKTIAANLHDAIDAIDIEKGIAALKLMNTTDDYSAVNTEFETTTVMFVRKTIVTGMLECFTDESQKVRIRLEFTRMGLKYDGTKFTLSGLPYRLISSITTSVFNKDGKETPVKINMALGHPVGVRNGWVYFFPFNTHVLLRVK
ncbi:MAG TPA: peptidoglycan-binding domain-containing protein, partial [Bacteroidia bacterium]|nr:peptidoglycan-binding domain-containing protein [Bacteroidia bacterium]